MFFMAFVCEDNGSRLNPSAKPRKWQCAGVEQSRQWAVGSVGRFGRWRGSWVYVCWPVIHVSTPVLELSTVSIMQRKVLFPETMQEISVVFDVYKNKLHTSDELLHVHKRPVRAPGL